VEGARIRAGIGRTQTDVVHRVQVVRPHRTDARASHVRHGTRVAGDVPLTAPVVVGDERVGAYDRKVSDFVSDVESRMTEPCRTTS